MICGRKTFPKFITHLPELYYIFLFSWRDSESSQKNKIELNKERKVAQPATGNQDVSQL